MDTFNEGFAKYMETFGDITVDSIAPGGWKHPKKVVRQIVQQLNPYLGKPWDSDDGAAEMWVERIAGYPSCCPINLEVLWGARVGVLVTSECERAFGGEGEDMGKFFVTGIESLASQLVVICDN